MNDIYVTLVGNVAAEPRQHTLTDGSRVTSLRVVTTTRYYDRRSQEWRDGDKTFFAVRCWRALGDNVAQSVRLGHPVVVQGRLRVREFAHEGERRFIAEVEATAVGHDLRWGVGSFSRPQRGAAPVTLDPETRIRLDQATEDWSFATHHAPTEHSPAVRSTPPAPGLPSAPAPVAVSSPEASEADSPSAGAGDTGTGDGPSPAVVAAAGSRWRRTGKDDPAQPSEEQAA